jgi:hypothetical protein
MVPTRKAILALLAMALAACAQKSADLTSENRELAPPTPIELSAEQVAAIDFAVRITLKHPDSGRFRDVRGSRSETGIVTACGWINAKDDSGRYAGERPFIGTFDSRSQFRLVNEMNTPTLLEMCQSASIPLA